MRLKVDITGVDAVTKSLAERFSQRRVAGVAATALTRAAVAGRAAVQRAMESAFDRPTPYTLRSVRYREATPQRLESEVYVSTDKGTRDPSPAVVLKPQVEGGGRGFKGFELALRSLGALPPGWKVMPGQGATLDAYGNVSRGLITRVLAQLRRTMVVGPKDARRIVKTVVKAGGSFFVVSPGKKMQPGIYRQDIGSRADVSPMFIFVNRAAYRKRLAFDEVIRREVARVLPPLIAQGFGESIGRMAGGAGARVIR